jgi:3,4-dihydroxy 2-butanone 4-phosphate synthase/GTP cyclohydrolase II
MTRTKRVDSQPPLRTKGAFLPTRHGEFTAYAYPKADGGDAHLALVHGDLQADKPVLVRMHSECLTGDALGSLRCDCGPQLERALQEIAAAPAGVLLYLRQEGRGIGLAAKIEAYVLQERGADTYDANVILGFPADSRDYRIAADMLRDLGVDTVALLTNNPAKAEALRSAGIDVVEERPLEIPPGRHNWRYLAVKRQRFGHRLHLPSQAAGAGAQ